MSKMGWKSGEGLGTDNKDTNLEPIDLDVRETRAGLGYSGGKK